MLKTHTLSLARKHWILTATMFGLQTRCAPRPRFHKQFFLSTRGHYRAWTDYVLLHSWQAEHAVGFTREWQPCSVALSQEFAKPEGYRWCANVWGCWQSAGVQMKLADTVVRFWKSRCGGHKPVRSVCQETHSTSRRKATPALGEDRVSGHRSECLSAEERAQRHFWWEVTVIFSWLILPRIRHGTTHRPDTLPPPRTWWVLASCGKQVVKSFYEACTSYAQVNVIGEEGGWQEEGKNCTTWSAARPQWHTWSFWELRILNYGLAHVSFHLLCHLLFFAICFVPSTKLFLCDLPRTYAKYISPCQGKKWVK